jgi:hypothetical protein
MNYVRWYEKSKSRGYFETPIQEGENFASFYRDSAPQRELIDSAKSLTIRG